MEMFLAVVGAMGVAIVSLYLAYKAKEAELNDEKKRQAKILQDEANMVIEHQRLADIADKTTKINLEAKHKENQGRIDMGARDYFDNDTL